MFPFILIFFIVSNPGAYFSLSKCLGWQINRKTLQEWEMLLVYWLRQKHAIPNFLFFSDEYVFDFGYWNPDPSVTQMNDLHYNKPYFLSRTLDPFENKKTISKCTLSIFPFLKFSVYQLINLPTVSSFPFCTLNFIFHALSEIIKLLAKGGIISYLEQVLRALHDRSYVLLERILLQCLNFCFLKFCEF